MQNDKLMQVNSVDELCEIKARYVDNILKWYGSHVTWPRIVFRITGIMVIVLSLGLPFLSSLKGDLQRLGVPIAAFLIAVLTALNSFFGWQRAWEKRMISKLSLEGLVARWGAEIVAAKAASEQNEGIERALKATQELIEQTRTITVEETGTFFANIKFPDVDVKTT